LYGYYFVLGNEYWYSKIPEPVIPEQYGGREWVIVSDDDYSPEKDIRPFVSNWKIWQLANTPHQPIDVYIYMMRNQASDTARGYPRFERRISDRDWWTTTTTDATVDTFVQRVHCTSRITIPGGTDDYDGAPAPRPYGAGESFDVLNWNLMVTPYNELQEILETGAEGIASSDAQTPKHQHVDSRFHEVGVTTYGRGQTARKVWIPPQVQNLKTKLSISTSNEGWCLIYLRDRCREPGCFYDEGKPNSGRGVRGEGLNYFRTQEQRINLLYDLDIDFLPDDGRDGVPVSSSNGSWVGADSEELERALSTVDDIRGNSERAELWKEAMRGLRDRRYDTDGASLLPSEREMAKYIAEGIGIGLLEFAAGVAAAEYVLTGNRRFRPYASFEDTELDRIYDSFGIPTRTAYERDPRVHDDPLPWWGGLPDRSDLGLPTGPTIANPKAWVDFEEETITFEYHNRPHFALVETNVFQSEMPHVSKRLLDNPPVAPNVDIVPYRSVKDKSLIMLNTAVGRYTDKPIIIEPGDVSQFREIITARNPEIDPADVDSRSIEEFSVIFSSDDYPQAFEIFRIEEPPNSYRDFHNGKNAKKTVLDNTARLAPGITEHRTGAHRAASLYRDEVIVTSNSFIDDIVPNKKYWYTFRTVDVHSDVSNPTGVLEFEMVDTGNSIFPVITEYKFPEEPTSYTKSMRKYLKISPSSIHTQRHPDSVGSVGGFIANPDLGGDTESSIWNKKYKLRVTSKLTGKKLDINFTFNQTFDNRLEDGDIED